MTGSSDQMVKVWLYNEGVPTHVGVGHAGVVTNVKVSPDGRFVVSTSADGGIFLWRFPHAADTAQPGSRCSADSGGDSTGLSARQQTDRSRQLSLKKAMPARRENINTVSKTQKVRAVLNGCCDGRTANAAASDGNVNVYGSATVADGSIKCLCRCACTCTGGDGDGRKSVRSSVR